MNKLTIKIWIQNAVNGVMDKPVAHAGLMDIPWLGIVYFEMLIRPVPICFFRKLAMKRENIIHKIDREVGDIFPLSFSA
jgi:hypothetical protein